MTPLPPSPPPQAETAASGTPLARRELILVILAGSGFGIFWALLLGQDLSWDLRNYYYYSAYAWLHGKVSYHIAPGQIQTWLNPLAYVPQYLLIHHAPPVVAGVILGAVAGLNFAVIYALTRSVMQAADLRTALAVCLFSAAAGVSTPQFLDATGRVTADPLVSMLVLGSLLAVCWFQRPGMVAHTQRYGYLASGVLLGAACGLKLTASIYAVGLTLTLLALWRILRLDWRQFGHYAAGGIAGFLLTGGYWAAFLWLRYGNPFFPFWNRVFRSEWAASANLADERFLPHTLRDALAFPFRWFAGDDFVSSESPFRDARFAVLAILLPVVLLHLGVLRFTGSASSAGTEEGSTVSRKHFWLIVFFFQFCYIVWMREFSIQRYLMPLGLLAGLLLFLLLDRVIAGKNAKAAIFIALTLFTASWSWHPEHDRQPYADNWFGVQLTTAVSQPNTLFLLLGDEPASYVIPFLPESGRAVRLSGNFLVPSSPDSNRWSGDFLLGESTLLGRTAREAIREHNGPIRSLAMASLGPGDALQLARFGLEVSEAGCETLRSRADEFTSCPLVPRASRPFLAADVHSQRLAWRASPYLDARLYVQGDDGPRQLHADGPDGYELLDWLQPGSRYVFEMLEWDGTTEGRLLATATIDEQGRASTDVFPTDVSP